MIEELRELALARNGAERHRFPLCLDDDLRAQINQAADDLKEAKAALDELAENKAKAKSLSSAAPTTTAKRRVQDLSDQIDALEQQAADRSIFIRMRRLPPAEYETLLHAHLDKEGNPEPFSLFPAITRSCYVDTVDAQDEDLRLSWGELTEKVLNSADMDALQVFAMNLNRAGSSISFTKASFGRLATN